VGDLRFRRPLATAVVRLDRVACSLSAASGWFRSCLVADACGARVLRGQGPIGRPATARPSYSDPLLIIRVIPLHRGSAQVKVTE
jgi:hypothetical protein